MTSEVFVGNVFALAIENAKTASEVPERVTPTGFVPTARQSDIQASATCAVSGCSIPTLQRELARPALLEAATCRHIPVRVFAYPKRGLCRQSKAMLAASQTRTRLAVPTWLRDG